MLCDFAEKLDEFASIPIHEKDLDEEITELRDRYFRLLSDELRCVIVRKSSQIKQLCFQAEVVDQHIIRAEREAERWKTRYEDLKEQVDKNAQE